MHLSSGFEKVFLSANQFFFSFSYLLCVLIICGYNFLKRLLIFYVVTMPLNFSVARGGQICSSPTGHEHK